MVEKFEEELIELLDKHNLSVKDFLEKVNKDSFWVKENKELMKKLLENSVEV